jgi:hypothetical protein
VDTTLSAPPHVSYFVFLESDKIILYLSLQNGTEDLQTGDIQDSDNSIM